MICHCCGVPLTGGIDTFGLPGDPPMCSMCWLSFTTFHAETKQIEEQAQLRAEGASPEERKRIRMDLHASVVDTPWGFIPRFRTDEVNHLSQQEF